MANIKISEMTEATSFDDGDYTMIVQANQNKKISRESIFDGIENDISTIDENIGDLSTLKTDDKSNVVDSINELKEREIYSTDEIKTNKVWIDNKPIYRKVINCGNLPNANAIVIAHNITDLDKLVSYSGFALRYSDNDLLPIPYVTFNPNNGGGITTFTDNAEIHIGTSSNRTEYVAYVTLEYTKTTD